MTIPVSPLSDMTARSREVFRLVVESYLASGEPVGSRTLSRSLSEGVSAATIRNTMQDLELLGLLNAPHTSAGRIPTELGLRLFVDGIMEFDTVPLPDRAELDRSIDGNESDLTGAIERAGAMLSGLTRGASLVMAPKLEAPIKHLEFVSLSPERALVVLVTADGQVENRLMTPPPGMTPSAMRQAANFLNAVLEGHTLSEARSIVSREITKNRAELDTLSQNLIKSGLAVWADDLGKGSRLVVRGRANLLEDSASAADLERIRQLFDDLEQKRDLEQLLSLTEGSAGVRIFIGSENKLFSLSGSALVVSPYMNAERKIVGAVGVIGPTRLNYARIVPIVDYTAQLMGRLVNSRSH
ncbi:MAG: heat-inducible transcriptional repressor HrcA [Paracoccaceae bacterium]